MTLDAYEEKYYKSTKLLELLHTSKRALREMHILLIKQERFALYKKREDIYTTTVQEINHALKNASRTKKMTLVTHTSKEYCQKILDIEKQERIVRKNQLTIRQKKYAFSLRANK